MDEILVPHPRRNFCLDRPKGQAVQYPDGFSDHDKTRVEEDATAARDAADIMKKIMSNSRIESDPAP